MDLFSVWRTFFEKYDDIASAVSAAAKRSGLTADEALSLILLNEFPEKADLLDTPVAEKLFLSGLAQMRENAITVTGKGAILAKSFVTSLSKMK